MVSPNFGDCAVSLDSSASVDNLEKNFLVLFLMTLSNGLDSYVRYSKISTEYSFVSLLGKKKMNTGVHPDCDYRLHCSSRDTKNSEKVFTSTVSSNLKFCPQLAKNTQVYCMYIFFFMSYIMQQRYLCECRKYI